MDPEKPAYPTSADMIDQWRSSVDRSGAAPSTDVSGPVRPRDPDPVDSLGPADPFAGDAIYPAPIDQRPGAEPRAVDGAAAPLPADNVATGPWPGDGSGSRSGGIAALFGIRTLISIGVIVFIAAGAWMARGQKSVVDLEVGDCFNDPGAAEELIETVKTIDCAEAHDFEVFAVLTAPMATYPGEAAMFEWADEACYQRFESYTGVPYEQSPFFLTSLIPVADGWADGDRGVDCVLGLSSDGFTITPVEGSQRAGGRI